MKWSLLAAAVPRLAATEECGSIGIEQYGAQAPEQCVANAGCAWLMLDGLCVESTDGHVAAMPSCCIGSDPCESKSVADAKDSVCRLSTTTNSKVVTSAPPLEELYHSLHLAGAAYCDQAAVEPWSCALHCDGAPTVSVSRYVEATDVLTGIFRAYVGYDSSLGAIVVAVRGTDNSQGIKNWVANLDYFKTRPYSQYPEAGVHEGFYKVWARVKEEVLAGIQDLAAEKGEKPVHFVGHSLGGAVATDGALDLVLNHGLTVGVHTFGSPRAGDHAYAVAIDEQLAYHFRITHNDDLVAHVPPEFMGFYHPAWEVHFPERTGLEYKLCDGSGEDNHCANACSFFLTCTSIDDHLNYLDIPATCGAGSLAANGTSVVV